VPIWRPVQGSDLTAGRVGARFLISGRVQGVGFRWFAMKRAAELDIGGWVANLPDGRVEVAAEGRLEALAEFEATMARGPMWARVDSVEKSAYPHELGTYKTFDVR